MYNYDIVAVSESWLTLLSIIIRFNLIPTIYIGVIELAGGEEESAFI